MYTILSSTVQNGFSPLYVASECGHTEIVDLLLGAGADVHQATKVHTCSQELISPDVADMLSLIIRIVHYLYP